MDLIRRARLPVPLFNAQLYDPAGSLIAVAEVMRLMWPAEMHAIRLVSEKAGRLT